MKFSRYQEIPCPLKYFSQHGNISYIYAGFALELLCKKIKGLREQIFAVRSNPQEIDKIADLINSESLGLFSELDELSITFYAEDALKIVIRKLYDGKLPKLFSQ